MEDDTQGQCKKLEMELMPVAGVLMSTGSLLRKGPLPSIKEDVVSLANAALPAKGPSVGRMDQDHKGTRGVHFLPAHPTVLPIRTWSRAPSVGQPEGYGEEGPTDQVVQRCPWC